MKSGILHCLFGAFFGICSVLHGSETIFLRDEMFGFHQRAKFLVNTYTERCMREEKGKYYALGIINEGLVGVKSKGPSKATIIGEGFGGLVGGAIGGSLVATISFIPLSVHYIKEDSEWGGLTAAMIALPIGYLVGVPLGSAGGVNTAGKMLHQNGSQKGALKGAAIGTLAGVGGVLLAVGANRLTEKGDFWVDTIAVAGICVGLTITATGPSIGAVYGYHRM